VEYGRLLTAFLEQTGVISKDDAYDANELIHYTGGAHQGKLSKLNVRVTFLRKFNWQIVLYFISFLLRFYINSLVKQVQSLKKVSLNGTVTYGKVEPSMCTKIYFLRKAHFILFNMWVVDFCFFAMRTILYMKNPSDLFGKMNLIAAYLMLFFIVCDIFYVFKSAN
jgi:hypothetical protein